MLQTSGVVRSLGAPRIEPTVRAASASARAYGVTFECLSNDPDLLPSLLARLPPGTRACPRPAAGSFSCSITRSAVVVAGGSASSWEVRLGAELKARTETEGAALDAFEGVVRFEVARQAPLWTFVHAGVVGWKGRAILMPGFSFAGKSTLVHALVRAGATYYSDEYAVLDQHGRAYPFAQPLTIREGSGANRRTTTDELGAAAGTRALPVGMVVSTRYMPGATWNPVRRSPAESVLALLEHTLRAHTAPARVLRLLARVAHTSDTFAGPRGEAANTAADLLDRAAAWQPE